MCFLGYFSTRAHTDWYAQTVRIECFSSLFWWVLVCCVYFNCCFFDSFAFPQRWNKNASQFYRRKSHQHTLEMTKIMTMIIMAIIMIHGTLPHECHSISISILCSQSSLLLHICVPSRFLSFAVSVSHALAMRVVFFCFWLRIAVMHSFLISLPFIFTIGRHNFSLDLFFFACWLFSWFYM